MNKIVFDDLLYFLERVACGVKGCRISDEEYTALLQGIENAKLMIELSHAEALEN